MTEEILRMQSEAAYKQWCTQWREHCHINSKFKMKPFDDFENIGVGKAILCVANGYSFEENVETIKKHQANVDILCCDKTLGHLLDNGITPTYCMVCDANVDYEKYMEKWKDKLAKTTLFINVCGNPKWVQNGNWKDTYFFVNRDVINSHVEFSQLSGCKNFLPAATNVSNQMVVLITQSDNDARRNFFGYDKILLIGFDYSWKFGGKYYAFDETGNGKADYMKHSYLVAPSGAFCYSSGNLSFSVQWLQKYIKTFGLPVVQCAKDSILHTGKVGNLEEQMQYSYKRHDASKVRALFSKLREIEKLKLNTQHELEAIGKDHYWHQASV